MNHLIEKIYSYSEYRSCDKPNSISATTLIGPLYKAKLKLNGAKEDERLIPFHLKRSSTLGTAFHKWAERALADDENVVQEIYKERGIIGSDKVYTISGSCDLLEKQEDGTYTIADWKTGYGRERKPDQLEKDMLQMSIYRWLLQDDYEVNDVGYTLFISLSNNEQGAIPIELMSIEDTQEYIEDRLFAIEENDRVDCNEGVKYNSCSYCSLICGERRS